MALVAAGACFARAHVYESVGMTFAQVRARLYVCVFTLHMCGDDICTGACYVVRMRVYITYVWG